jgi:hypothetical protein
MFFVCQFCQIWLLSKHERKKKFKKKTSLYIFLATHLGFVMTGYLISSTSLKTVVIYQKPVLVIV